MGQWSLFLSRFLTDIFLHVDVGVLLFDVVEADAVVMLKVALASPVLGMTPPFAATYLAPFCDPGDGFTVCLGKVFFALATVSTDPLSTTDKNSTSSSLTFGQLLDS